MCRLHVEPRVKLHPPREESCLVPLVPLKYIDVTRVTHATLDVLQQGRIGNYWNIDASRDLSDTWTGFTQYFFLRKSCRISKSIVYILSSVCCWVM